MTEYAVGLEHLFWVEADDEDEAIEKAITEIADLSEDDLRDLDIDVLDRIETATKYVVYDESGHEHGVHDQKHDAYDDRNICEREHGGTFHVEEEERRV